MQPLVSIIVPVFNCAQDLPACLASIVAQTYPNWQAVLVDDGSTDASGRLCDEAAAAEPRFVVYHQPNGGVSAARKAGLAAGKGGYIAFVDADDLLHPTFLSRLVAAVKQTGAAVVGCALATFKISPVFDEAAKSLRRQGRPSSLSFPESAVALLQCKEVNISVCNKLYKASLLTGELFNTALQYNEDLWLNWHVFLGGADFTFVPFVGYFYRERAGSASQGVLCQKQLDDQLVVARRMAADGRRRQALAEPTEAFLFERWVYLYTCIAREEKPDDFKEEQTELRQNICQSFGRAMRLPSLPLRMKLAVCGIGAAPWLYRRLCRIL